MLFIYLFTVASLAQINLEWKLYEPGSSTIATDTSLTFGQYGKEVRIQPSDGSSFKSEFMVSGNLPLSPQFPMARINEKYVAFYVGITEASGTKLTITKSLNPQYEFTSNQITFSATNKLCIVVPNIAFMTIPLGGVRDLTLDFINCIPIADIQIQMLYNSITKTIITKNQQRYSTFSVSSLTSSIGDKIQVTFTVNSIYYQISSIALTVIDSGQIIPVPTLSNINTGTCLGISGQFKVGCGKKAVVYYSYYYQGQLIDLITIKAQLQLRNNRKSYTNVNSYEGYGTVILPDANQGQITISNLRSNTQYTLFAICEDEVYQQQLTSTTFIRCDSNQAITLIKLQTYLLLHQINLRDIVCDLMISQQLRSYQVSTDNGLFCDVISQSKYNGNKYYEALGTTQTPNNYTIFIYPDYATTNSISINEVTISNYQISSTLISQINPIVPIVHQEYFIANDKQLNFTIALKSDGFILIGLDLISPNQPNYFQFHHGMNFQNAPFMKFYKQYLIAKQKHTFYFSVSDKNTYQLMYLLQSDPSEGAQYSNLIIRSFSLAQMQESKNMILLLNVFILIFANL